MKKIFFLASIAAFSMYAGAQTESLEGNKMEISLSNTGLFLAQPDESITGLNLVAPGCEFPKGSGRHIMNGLSMWFGGVDEFGEARVSTPTKTNLEEQFSGPLSIGSLQGSFYEFESFFKVTREEINYHVTNYQQPNYEPIPSIREWPAHGDVTFELDFYLAPFVDADGDGYYDPMAGDFPCIKGDEAIYMIMNDKESHAHCGALVNNESLGIEIHYLFYQYTSIQELANTTFCEARIINRSNANYRDFTSSTFMNASIGDQNDDFFGTDEERNMMYAYNGDEFDVCYGDQPPAVGIVSLNKKISRSRVFGNHSNTEYHFPSIPAEFFRVMRGGLLTEGNYPERFEYAGNPVLATGDIQSVSEQAHSMIYSIDIGDLVSGADVKFDFAIVAGKGETHLNSIEALRESVDFVQHFYDESEGLCIQGEVGFPEDFTPTKPEENSGIIVFPNPSNGEFLVEIEENWIGSNVSVFNVSGVLLASARNVTQLQTQFKVPGGPGIYLVSLEKDGVSKIVKAVVE